MFKKYIVYNIKYILFHGKNIIGKISIYYTKTTLRILLRDRLNGLKKIETMMSLMGLFKYCLSINWNSKINLPKQTMLKFHLKYPLLVFHFWLKLVGNSNSTLFNIIQIFFIRKSLVFSYFTSIHFVKSIRKVVFCELFSVFTEGI